MNQALIKVFLLFIIFVSVTGQCPTPSFAGNSYSVVDVGENGGFYRISVTPSPNANSGWSIIAIFPKPLNDDLTIQSYTTEPQIGEDRRVVTFSNIEDNADLSNLQQFSFAYYVESTTTDLSSDVCGAIVGFIDTRVADASCVLEPNPIEPLPTTTTAETTSTTSTTPVTTSSTSIATTTTPTTTTTSAATTTAITTTTSCTASDATSVPIDIENTGWNNGGKWTFIFKYTVPADTYSDWTIKAVFSKEVTGMTPYEAEADGPFSEGRVWFLTAQSWNQDINNDELAGTVMTDTIEAPAPEVSLYIYKNGELPDDSISVGGGCESSSTTSSSTSSSTTTTSTVTVSSTQAPTIDPSGSTGSLPDEAEQTILNFTLSLDVDGDNPYDYNELLHKSLLFYEAQRSGELPESNRIPWRGDSGLLDGCVGGVCSVDLTGGWYDAGDFVKFGFPMAWSATVLAWGMIEFKSAYIDADEWDNALDNLKWATDYFIKAHVSPNELYFQVGDPDSDHSYWGHPETMTMERPIFKIDTNNPGTEVAAETAAALAAASIVFKDSDQSYSTNLLNHAIQLFDFADNYRGNYHDSVSESKVGNFYKSWSGYSDELMWAAMWLHEATDDNSYLQNALQYANSVGTSEFSWDNKGPGALVLLAQVNSMYKTNLFSTINNVMNKQTTPAGLTYFSQWGTNRYAANYALIALMAAKMEGVSSTNGQNYHTYAKEQISYMLGSGDGSRSYVVGFGNDYPKRPHHRSSSCRLWTSDPSSQICDSTDRDSSGPNPLILYGALVGGPGLDGTYVDVRSDYVKNEVAVDYNAGFQSAIAGLKYFQMRL